MLDGMALHNAKQSVFCNRCSTAIIHNKIWKMNMFTSVGMGKLRRVRGFSLIEVLVVMGIIGILASIALPSYQKYLTSSNRSAAQSHLLDIAQAQQQFLADNRAYASTLAELNGMTTPAKVSDNFTITIDVSAGPPPTFMITATPKAGTQQASDVTLTINQAGNKTPAEKW
jgi:type IV pilus assembly protein PilE